MRSPTTPAATIKTTSTTAATIQTRDLALVAQMNRAAGLNDDLVLCGHLLRVEAEQIAGVEAEQRAVVPQVTFNEHGRADSFELLELERLQLRGVDAQLRSQLARA